MPRSSISRAPREINHIVRANEKGLSEIDDIEIVGDSLEVVRRDFKRA